MLTVYDNERVISVFLSILNLFKCKLTTWALDLIVRQGKNNRMIWLLYYFRMFFVKTGFYHTTRKRIFPEHLFPILWSLLLYFRIFDGTKNTIHHLVTTQRSTRAAGHQPIQGRRQPGHQRRTEELRRRQGQPVWWQWQPCFGQLEQLQGRLELSEGRQK